MAQRVHRRMNLAAFAFLRAVITATPATLRRGLHRATVQDDRCWEHCRVVMPDAATPANLPPSLQNIRRATNVGSVVEPHATAADRWASSATGSPPAQTTAARCTVRAGNVRAAARPPSSMSNTARRTPTLHRLHHWDNSCVLWSSPAFHIFNAKGPAKNTCIFSYLIPLPPKVHDRL